MPEIESKKTKPSRLGRGLGSLFSPDALGMSQDNENPKPVPGPKVPNNVVGKNAPSSPIEKAAADPLLASQTPARELASEAKEVPSQGAQFSSHLSTGNSGQGSKSQEIKGSTQETAPQPRMAEAVEVKEEMRIWMVQIDKVRPAKDQPRKEFDAEELRDLAQSIRQKGIIQPITVRKGLNNEFEIVAGERRWRAAQQAGLHEVPVIIKKLDKQSALEVALIENIQRSDLNPIEEAEAYQYLISKYHLTQQQLSEKVGKERATVTNSMRLLALAPEVREWVKAGELTVGHAKVILGLQDHDTQKKTAKKVMNLHLSVRSTEKLIQSMKQGQTEEVPKTQDLGQKLAMGTAQDLQKIVGRKVSIAYKNGQGSLSLHFHSDTELSDIIEKLKNSWRANS